MVAKFIQPLFTSRVEANVFCGIYAIVHKFSGDIYIGSSKNINSRFAHHKLDLLVGKHHNKTLQKDFDFYDRDLCLFGFIVVKELPINAPAFYRHSIEQRFIYIFSKTDKLYNIATPSKRSGMTYVTMKLLTYKEKLTNLFND